MLPVEDEPVAALPPETSSRRQTHGCVYWNKQKSKYLCVVGIRYIYVKAYAKTLAAALELQTILVSIRRYVEELVRNGEPFAAAFPQAVRRAVDDAECDKPSLSFCFEFRLRPFAVYAYLNSSEEAAEFWTRWSAVRSGGWPACRTLFIELWSKKAAGMQAKEAQVQARAAAADSKWDALLVRRRASNVSLLAKRVSKLLEQKRTHELVKLKKKEEREKKLTAVREERQRAQAALREERKRVREEEKQREEEQLEARREELKMRQRAVFAAAAARMRSRAHL